MIPVGFLGASGDGTGVITSLGVIDAGTSTGYVSLPAGTNTFTKNSFSIGAAAPDRMVVVNVGMASGDFLSAVACTGVTCNGIPMIAIGNNAATQSSESTLFYLLVPTGTTANFVFTFTTSTETRIAQMYGYTVKGYSGRAPDIINANAGVSAFITPNIGDSIISVAAGNNAGAVFNASQMTSFTINRNQTYNVPGSARYGACLSASYANAAAAAIIITPQALSNSNSQRRCYALWRHQ